MKHKIMEAILSSDNNLTKEEIDWAITNIPNEGKSARQFNHDIKLDIMEACGYQKSDKMLIKDELSNLVNESNDNNDACLSQLIERIISHGSVDLHNYLIIKSILDITNKKDEENPLDKLLNLLKNLK